MTKSMTKSELKKLLDERFKQVEYIENLTEAFSSVTNLVQEPLRQYVYRQKFLSGSNYKEIQDPRITELILLEADEYLAKSLYNFCSACALMNRGYLSWGEVTRYYSSFFAIHGLLRIQGKAIGTNYVICPKSIRSPASIKEHEYMISSNIINKGIHEDVWNKFHDTYSQNSDIDQTEYASSIFFSDPQDLLLEVERRNTFNYHTFEAYQEIFDSSELNRRDLYDLRSLDPQFFINLSYYVGDRNYGYLAKSALRMRLLHDLLCSIAEESPVYKPYFLSRHNSRLSFLNLVLQASDPVELSAIELNCLVMP